MIKTLADRLVGWAQGRLPSRVTAKAKDGTAAMFRWEILPLNRWLNVYIHRFLASDEDRALHDHPWWGLSIILRGSYVDVTAAGRLRLVAGDWLIRPPKRAHRIELPDGECWTLFIVGPRIREWGFHCPGGWVGYREFNHKGCGE